MKGKTVWRCPKRMTDTPVEPWLQTVVLLVSWLLSLSGLKRSRNVKHKERVNV